MCQLWNHVDTDLHQGPEMQMQGYIQEICTVICLSKSSSFLQPCSLFLKGPIKTQLVSAMLDIIIYKLSSLTRYCCSHVFCSQGKQQRSNICLLIQCTFPSLVYILTCSFLFMIVGIEFRITTIIQKYFRTTILKYFRN